MNHDKTVFYIAPTDPTLAFTAVVGAAWAIDSLRQQEALDVECRIIDRHDNEYAIYDDYSSGTLQPNLTKV